MCHALHNPEQLESPLAGTNRGVNKQLLIAGLAQILIQSAHSKALHKRRKVDGGRHGEESRCRELVVVVGGNVLEGNHIDT